MAINGGQLYDAETDVVYQDRQLYGADIEKIIANMAPLDLGVSFFTDSDTQYIIKMTDQLKDAQRRNNYKYIEVGNDFSIFDRVPVNKVMFRVEEGHMDEVEAFVAEHPFVGYDSFKTQPVCYEVIPHGISKATAIEKYRLIHGIEKDEIITFGDTSNDNAMLKEYYGVCLKNGTADTLAIADEITELNAAEDGFADYLERNIINKK
ncbi:MAG: HAD hydrolase family protein [Erysipelotrichaceae bacterium]|nr:HAD hydrolase family protein [Erysipelotrichaceae bacterium]